MARTGTTLHLTLLLFWALCGPTLCYKLPSISNISPVSFHYLSPVHLNNRVLRRGSASAKDNQNTPFRCLHICGEFRYVPVKKCCTATNRSGKKSLNFKPGRFVACRFLLLVPVLRTIGRQIMTHFFPVITHCASSFQLFGRQWMRRFDITNPQRPEWSFLLRSNSGNKIFVTFCAFVSFLCNVRWHLRPSCVEHAAF